jgi:hypothetical protein
VWPGGASLWSECHHEALTCPADEIVVDPDARELDVTVAQTARELGVWIVHGQSKVEIVAAALEQAGGDLDPEYHRRAGVRCPKNAWVPDSPTGR